MMAIRRTRRDGFTLLEIVVASVLFTFVAAAAYSVFDAGSRMTRNSEFNARFYQTARSVLGQMERDIRGAWFSDSEYETALVGRDQAEGDVPFDEIEVLAINRHAARRAAGGAQIDLSKVVYYIRPEEEGEPALLRRRTGALLEQTLGTLTEEEENVEEVAANVVGLNIRYYDDEWKEEWDSSKSESYPKAVEVTVLVRAERRGEEVVEEFTSRFAVPLWRSAEKEEEQQK